MADTMLIVAADGESLVSQCGGAMARYAAEGWEVHALLLCESQEGPWAQACALLGAKGVQCPGYAPAPLEMPLERLDHLACILRALRPKFILTHDKETDPARPDHDTVSRAVLSAYNIASGAGAPCGGLPVSPRQTPMFGLEPEEPELCRFRPRLYLDITAFQARKEAALVQAGAAETAAAWALRAQLHARRVRGHGGSAGCRYAEAFSGYGPIAAHGYFVW